MQNQKSSLQNACLFLMRSPIRCLAILTMQSPKGCLGTLLYWRSSLRYDALLFWQQSLQCTALLCCMEMQSSVVYMYIYTAGFPPLLLPCMTFKLPDQPKERRRGRGGQGCRKLSSCNQRMVLSLAHMYGTLDMQSTKYCMLTLSERSQVVYDLGDFNVPYFKFFPVTSGEFLHNQYFLRLWSIYIKAIVQL